MECNRPSAVATKGNTFWTHSNWLLFYEHEQDEEHEAHTNTFLIAKLSGSGWASVVTIFLEYYMDYYYYYYIMDRSIDGIIKRSGVTNAFAILWYSSTFECSTIFLNWFSGPLFSNNPFNWLICSVLLYTHRAHRLIKYSAHILKTFHLFSKRQFIN